MIPAEEKIWYVYFLCDPETPAIPFYVGKGAGHRMYQHELCSDRDCNEEKKRAIRAIHARGKHVFSKKVAEFTVEQDAYIYEWAMINLFRDYLTNIRTGGILIHQGVALPRRKATRRVLKKEEDMATFYTAEEKENALFELRIRPVDGRVDGDEAARILSWRAKHEHGVEHTYKIGTINKHAEKLGAVPLHSRKNLYDVNAVFSLQIEPKRGNQKQTRKIS